MVRGDAVRPIRDFLAAFGRAFLPATLVWLAGLGLAGLLAWEWVVAGRLVSPVAAAVTRGLVLLGGLLLGLAGVVTFFPTTLRGATARSMALVAAGITATNGRPSIAAK